MRLLFVARFIAVAIATTFASSSLAGAEVANSLQCHKVKDGLSIKGAVLTVTATDAAFQISGDCELKPGKAAKLCLPAEKTIVNPGDATLVGTEPGAGDEAREYLCYKAKCPKPTTDIADLSATDKFGTHALTKIKATKEICVPAIKGSTVTTTTTTLPACPTALEDLCESYTLNFSPSTGVAFTCDPVGVCTEFCDGCTTTSTTMP